MGWRTRVLRGRVRDQATVLGTVTAVTLVATTLLGTFAFLLGVTGQDAVGEAMARLPDESLTVETVARVRLQDTQQVLDVVDEVVAATLGDVPVERSMWLTGRLWSLPRPEGARAAPLVYAASVPGIEERAELVSGAWPTTARDAAGRTAVNVPAVAADRYGWALGTTLTVGTPGNRQTDTWVVVGTHRLTGATSAWSRDPLGGASHVDDHPVPGTMGNLTTDAWGPALVAPEALLGPDVVDQAHVLVVPDLSRTGPRDLERVRERLDGMQVRLSVALDEVDVSGHVRTQLATAIDAAWRELAVTRIGVVVVGLLLVVLATTVMLLAARLLAERRAAEGELVAARGASPAQLRSLAALEAGVLAVGTAAVAPWLARLVAVRLAQDGPLADAGLAVPPGVPLGVHLACAAVAVVLGVALVVPSWHVSGSSSAPAHAGVVRTGADLALVALGAVALWQLLDHGAPLTRSPDGARLDPVLTAGPALVTLAAAVLALRLVAPVGLAADAMARRSTSLVAPLAAWQVARRPAVAAGTTLVVVLAVTTATFAHAFLATWRTSQLEQVDLQLGTDGRVDDARGERLTLSGDARTAFAAASAHVGADGRAFLQPVTDRTVRVGQSLDGVGSTGFDTHLLAVDTTRGDALRGRAARPWPRAVADLGGTDATPVGTPLPGDPHWLVADVVTDASPAAVGAMYLGVAVQDASGVTAWLSGPELPLGQTTPVALEVPRSAGPLHVVALSALVGLDAVPADAAMARTAEKRRGSVGLALQHVRVVDRAAGVQRAGDALLADGTPVTLDARDWDGHSSSALVERPVLVGPAVPAPRAADLAPDALVLAGVFDLVDLEAVSGRFVVHAWPQQRVVRAVVSAPLAERGDLRQGSLLNVGTGGAVVRVEVARVVPHLPGAPREPALLVDRAALARAVTEAGGVDPLADGWWVTAPDAHAPVLTEAVADAVEGRATVRATAREAAVAGPLRVGVPAALSLVTAATAVLVLVGTGAAAAAAVRSRRLELARLQALGAARRSLVVGLLGEHTLLVVLGAGAGLLIGHVLARVVAPVLTVSPDGRRPVPAPLPVWDATAALGITAGLVLGACAVVGVLAALLVRRASGALLRLGDDR